MKAWHFVGPKLRNGAPVPEDGKKWIQTGEIIPCQNGLHGSVRIIDALLYGASKPIQFYARLPACVRAMFCTFGMRRRLSKNI
jgi:hypothetical protein